LSSAVIKLNIKYKNEKPHSKNQIEKAVKRTSKAGGNESGLGLWDRCAMDNI